MSRQVAVKQSALQRFRCAECGRYWWAAKELLESCLCAGHIWNFCPHRRCADCGGYRPVKGVE